MFKYPNLPFSSFISSEDEIVADIKYAQSFSALTPMKYSFFDSLL